MKAVVTVHNCNQFDFLYYFCSFMIKIMQNNKKFSDAEK